MRPFAVFLLIALLGTSCSEPPSERPAPEPPRAVALPPTARELFVRDFYPWTNHMTFESFGAYGLRYGDSLGSGADLWMDSPRSDLREGALLGTEPIMKFWLTGRGRDLDSSLDEVRRMLDLVGGELPEETASAIERLRSLPIADLGDVSTSELGATGVATAPPGWRYDVSIRAELQDGTRRMPLDFFRLSVFGVSDECQPPTCTRSR